MPLSLGRDVRFEVFARAVVEGIKARPGSGGKGKFILRATLGYLDVFGQKHDASWCWLDSTGSAYPVTCGFDWRRNFPGLSD